MNRKYVTNFCPRSPAHATDKADRKKRKDYAVTDCLQKIIYTTLNTRRDTVQHAQPATHSRFPMNGLRPVLLRRHAHQPLEHKLLCAFTVLNFSGVEVAFGIHIHVVQHIKLPWTHAGAAE